MLWRPSGDHAIQLCRRGHYADGCSNADTFWRAVLRKHTAAEALQAPHPPLDYYSSFVEPEDLPAAIGMASRPRLAASA